MNKIISTFLSSALVVSTSFAGPIVNKMGTNPFNTQISAGIEKVLGSFSQIQALNDDSVSFYETFPVTSFLELSGANAVSLVSKSSDPNSVVMTDYISIPKQGDSGTHLGLRMVLAPQDARLAVSQQMAEAGLIKTGDILVSARPQFANSLRYLALQLLSTHVSTAVVVTENGRKVVYNMDMPMDADMLGGAAVGFGKSVMDSNHFTSENSNLMLHVLRPRISDEQRANMQKWLELGLQKAREKKIYPASISFNSNYESPMYREGKKGLFSSGKADLSFVADTGRLMLDQGLKANQHLQMYCSEFGWTMLSLRNCNPSDKSTVSDFSSGKTPSCVSEFFKPMQMFGSAFSSGSPGDEDYYGMTDGIPMLIKASGAELNPATGKLSANELIEFSLPASDREAKGLSNGHKGVAQAMAPLIAQANGYFKALFTQPAQVIDGARAQFNPNSLRNYSPTAFVVHAAMPNTVNGQKVEQKKLDYVATIKYIPKNPQFQALQSK